APYRPERSANPYNAPTGPGIPGRVPGRTWKRGPDPETAFPGRNPCHRAGPAPQYTARSVVRSPPPTEDLPGNVRYVGRPRARGAAGPSAEIHSSRGSH